MSEHEQDLLAALKRAHEDVEEARGRARRAEEELASARAALHRCRADFQAKVVELTDTIRRLQEGNDSVLD